MKKSVFLLTTTMACSIIYYQNIGHVNASQAQVQSSIHSQRNSINLPWGNTGLTVTLDADGTLHIPSGSVTNPPALYTIFGDVGSPGSKAIKNIEFDGPLVLYGNASLLFSMLPNASELSGLSNLYTKNVLNMDGMFRECQSLTLLDLSNFNTSALKDMTEMFAGCNSLVNLNLHSYNHSFPLRFKA